MFGRMPFLTRDTYKPISVTNESSEENNATEYSSINFPLF
jgi:hypothetical protein